MFSRASQRQNTELHKLVSHVQRKAALLGELRSSDVNVYLLEGHICVRGDVPICIVLTPEACLVPDPMNPNLPNASHAVISLPMRKVSSLYTELV